MSNPITPLTGKLALLVDSLIRRCPKSGRIVGIRRDTSLSRILFPIVGLLAIVWFLVRVIPKPSRAEYPCQRFALGLGGGLVLNLVGLGASLVFFRKAGVQLRRSVAVGGVLACIGVAFLIPAVTELLPAEPIVSVLTPAEGANQPMGVARGIFPGRVVWTQDFDATSWDGETGKWWEDTGTNQAAVTAMFAKSIQNLTGAETNAKAWDKLFRFQNNATQRGDTGYVKGEKIVIKINCNASTKPDMAWTDKGYTSPHVLFALVQSLIEEAGVSGDDIIITDPSRFISTNLSNKVRSGASPEYKKVVFEQKEAQDLPGYVAAQPDENNKVYFVMPDGKTKAMCWPKSYSDATYQINFAQVRPHRVFGITSMAKNQFGAIYDIEKKQFHPGVLHAFALWDYPTPNLHGDPNCHPLLLGHKTVRDKTILYMADGLYTALNQSGSVLRWSSLNDKWFSSLLMSLDPVAMESVNLDLISAEPNLYAVNPSFNGNQDSQLHESAMAGNPNSGTQYDPEGDGTPLASLGVHEHWNNAIDKQYTRNMGTGEGIELIRL